jgi:DNA-binding transcriptional LysR family regulator
MTLEQLRIFLAVAERGHVTRAARVLNLTQSAVSAAISTLEAQHGVRLFDRIGRGIEITEAGRTFMDAAQAVMAEAETARLVLADLAQDVRGRLRIHASQTVASYWLPPFLITLHERHAGLDLVLMVGNTAQVAQAVTNGAADLGFVEGDVPQNDLRRRVVDRDELVLVMSPDHLFAKSSSLGALDYGRTSWVLREPGSGTRSEFEAHLRAMSLSVDDLDVALELPSNEAILAAVAAGRCISILSRRAVEGAVSQGVVRIRSVTWAPRPERSFAVLTHPARHRTRAAEALLNLIDEAR